MDCNWPAFRCCRNSLYGMGCTWLEVTQRSRSQNSAVSARITSHSLLGFHCQGGWGAVGGGSGRDGWGSGMVGFSFTEWGLPALGSAQAPRMAEKTEPAYRLVRLPGNRPGYQRFLPDAMLAV